MAYDFVTEFEEYNSLAQARNAAKAAFNLQKTKIKSDIATIVEEQLGITSVQYDFSFIEDGFTVTPLPTVMNFSLQQLNDFEAEFTNGTISVNNNEISVRFTIE